MSQAREQTNRAMLRVRDTIDRDYDQDLDVERLARLVHLSPDHLIRTFRSVFGETPHRYLQRRRIERAMFLLRTTDLDVTEVCLAVGFTSLGTFSRLFSAVVGQSPSAYARRHPPPAVPGCFVGPGPGPAASPTPRPTGRFRRSARRRPRRLASRA